MSDPFIRTGIAAHTERCLAALTLAFSGDPPCRWAWPDPQQYLEAVPRFARAFGGGAIVALWLPPGAAPDEESLARKTHNSLSFSFSNASGGFSPPEK